MTPGSEMPTVFQETSTTVVVTSRTEAADGVVALTLAHPDGDDLPRWSPGAHIDVVLTPELTRQYSLCGHPRDRKTWRIGVLNVPDSRGGSRYVHDHLQEGVSFEVRGPRNHFPLVHADRYLFIGGGIGITPMLPMVAAAAALGTDYTLLYGGRSLQSMAFLDELEPYGGSVVIVPQDTEGHLPLAGHLGRPAPGTLVYCCGPEPLLAAVEEQCRRWPSGSLHTERFAAKEVEASQDSLDSFVVDCQQSGISLTVGPGESILEVAEANGISLLSSCRDGICGTCETGVIEGEPEHLDSVLGEDEKASNTSMMVCVSRSRSPRLVLDL